MRVTYSAHYVEIPDSMLTKIHKVAELIGELGTGNTTEDYYNEMIEDIKIYARAIAVDARNNSDTSKFKINYTNTFKYHKIKTFLYLVTKDNSNIEIIVCSNYKNLRCEISSPSRFKMIFKKTLFGNIKCKLELIK